ncbi:MULTISPECIES: fatty acyl-AMP ligase [Serratia]|uniref:fatty acyl-AMP ligase n=1 Tax=Serratia TaxID=613 RepID=UPI0015743100|nr:fatty acyl-AMP ligase [Serratia marcescens]MBI6135789.1 fatty acyl-AMP ligase [Serratia marcescens]MDN0030245.1 fatty acyl-AMP ligase [Serratia marcescens]NSM19602.1 AMP-binding protein [Serratia marcescens]NSM46723.1 AMP-binding protein [Serratia marcescens]
MTLAAPRFSTLPAALDHHAAAIPDAQALMRVNHPLRDEKNRPVSYRQLRDSALHLAIALHETCAPGSRILLPTSVSEYFAVGFLACLYAGMVAVPSPLPTQYQHQRQRLNNIMRDAGIVALLCSPEDEAAIRAWLEQTDLRCPIHTITLKDDAPCQTLSLPLPASDGLALLQYTSGSTGDPKGVMLTHGNLIHNANSFQQTLGYADDTRFGGWIPQYHDMGLMAQLLPALLLGSCCYMMTPTQFLKRPLHWLKMIERFRINHSCAPNFAFELCRRRITPDELGTLDLSSLHYLINGSEPIQADTIAEFTDYFLMAGFKPSAMQPCYGMAECTVFISGSPPRPPRIVARQEDAAKAARHFVSCGTARHYEVKIVDPHSRRPLSAGESGEIWLRGGSVAKGYWNKPQATEETFAAYTACGQGPYMRTGDIGFLQHGEIFVSARIKEVIITHGKNLYPQDIEHGLRRQFPSLAGRYGAVFGVNLAAAQETLVVCHELPGSFNDAELAQFSAQIQSWVQSEWGAPLAAVILVPPGEVSRTTSGKIQRTAMKQRFFAQTLRTRHQWLSSAASDALGKLQPAHNAAGEA